VKKRKGQKGHLQVSIDPKIYAKLKKAAKKQGKSVDDLAKEVFLKTVKKKKRR
jgi:predicted HicB family RNase H-like nuclease